MRTVLVALMLFALPLSACENDGGGGDADGQVRADGAVPGDGAIPGDGATPADGAVGVDAASPGDGGTIPPPADCDPLPAPTGTVVEVYPTDADTLRDTVLGAASGTTILLHDGLYLLDGGDNSHRLSFYNDHVTLRSASGNREAVTLDGGGVTGEVITIAASHVTIADVTIRRAYYHPIHVTGGDVANTVGTRIYNVHVVDPGEQAIKINSSGNGTYADQGRVECSHLELTDAGRLDIRNNCYTGGVDGHQAWGWEIRLNLIQGFWCPAGLSEHAVHFWTGSRDTLTERNVIRNCARGVGYGLGESGANRVYADDPYPGVGYLGHIDGIIRNNTIYADLGDRFDTGIMLDQAHGAQVLHNTVVSLTAPFNCIEWRFDNTDVTITNNLVSHNLMDRGGVAVLAGNLEQAPLGWFVDGAGGNLHLAPGAGALGAGVAVPAGLCDVDLDGDVRGSPPDVGADEVP